MERTRIRAPYSGRILAKNVDIGEVVPANTSLARIYATDRVEIRLPIKNSELGFIELPEQYVSGETDGRSRTTAKIANRLLGEDIQYWPATLVSTAGAIDEQSQQLYVTARIEHPYARDGSGRRPLKIGQYVSAEINGKTLHGALVIPNSSVYQGSYVYLFRDGLLQRREIEIAWQNGDEALIGKGLAAGDQLVLTPLGQVSSGTRVKLLRGDDGKALTGSGTGRPDAPGEQHPDGKKSG